jgi:hypothetical protein
MAIDKIVIQYEAQVAGFKKDLDGIKKQLGAVEKKAVDGGKKTEQAFQNAGKGSNQFASNLKTLAGTMGIMFGAQQILSFAKESVKAANVQLQAEGKLRQALQGREEMFDRLTKRASELQKVTVIGDEVIIQQQAFLAAQGRSEEEINKTIDAAVQLSDVMGVDIHTAVRQLDTTLEGNVGLLGKLDAGFKTLTVEQLKNGGAIDLVNEKYKGFAEKTAATGTGRLQQLQNAFGDLQEEIGKQLLPTLQEGALTLNNFIQAVNWSEIFSELGEIVQTLGEPIKQLYSSLGDIFEAFTANMSAGEKTAGVFDSIAVAVNVATTPMRVIAKLFKHLTDNILVPLITTGQKVITWFGEVRESGGFVGAVFDRIAAAAGGVIDKMRGVAEFIGIIDTKEEASEKLKIKAEEAKKKAIENKVAAEQAAAKEKSAADAKAKQEEDKKTQEQIDAAKEAAKKKKEINKAFAAAILKISDEVTLGLIEDENERAAKQLQLQKAAEIRELEASEFNANQKGQLKAQIDAKYDQLEKDRQEKLIEDKKKKEQEFADFLEDLNNQSREDENARAKETIAFYNNATTTNADRLQEQLDDELAMYANLVNNGFPESEEKKLRIADYFAKKRKEVEQAQGDEATQGQIDNIGKVESKMGEVFGAVNSVLGPAMDALNGYFDLQLNNLEKEKNQRLANENLTAEERLRIEEEYEAKKNAILAEQFEVSRGAQIIEATIAAANAALNAFASTAAIPVVGPGLAAAAAAIAGAFGALQIGIIAAQPNPYKFFEGTDYLQLGGNPRGKDTIPVMAHEGEAIIPTGKNLQYPGLAKSWIDGNLDSYIHKKFISPALMEQQREMEADFADKIAASMALQMTGGFDDYRLFRAIKEQTAIQRVGFENLKTTRKKLRGA